MIIILLKLCLDLQEKRILLYIERVLGVRIVMSEKLTSQMREDG